VRLLPVALALLLAACGPKDTTVQDVRDIRKSYYEFRDALLQGDDRAFFSLHCAEARRWAVDNFPSVRAEFLTGGAEGRAAFLRQYRVTEEEFLKGDPRDLVARMMPIGARTSAPPGSGTSPSSTSPGREGNCGGGAWSPSRAPGGRPCRTSSS
jgi:hypothetical protein